jgi:hypothetical protein
MPTRGIRGSSTLEDWRDVVTLSQWEISPVNNAGCWRTRRNAIGGRLFCFDSPRVGGGGRADETKRGRNNLNLGILR